jgi:3-hydroxyisobutyrate dehydrogenase-like beta-hydroxyacid dehydrogenase
MRMPAAIGIIGTGVMGGAMARRLLACGFHVAVFDAKISRRRFRRPPTAESRHSTFER